MDSLRNLCDVSFHDPERSKANTFAGFLDHTARFLKPVFSGGPVDAALTAAQVEATALAEEVRAAQVAVGTSQAQQQDGRAATEADRKRAIKRVQENAAALDTSYFIADARERQRLTALLYPGGLEPLTRASLRDLPDLLATYMATVETEETALGQPFYTQTMADLAPFAATRTKQIEQKAATGQARTERRDLVADVENQLTYHYHLLSAHYRGQWATVATYYDARYFDDQQTGREGQRRGRAAGETKTVLDLGAADPAFVRVTLTVDDDGKAPLDFARAASAAEPPTAWLAVAPDVPQTVELAKLPGAGPLLVVRNAAGTVGHYRVALGK